MKQTDDVKKNIIIAARAYFSHYGFQKTTMSEIAKKIHKAKGVLYYYFKSKEELYAAVLESEFLEVKAKLSEVIKTDKDAVSKIESYILLRFELLQKSLIYHESLRADFTEKYLFAEASIQSFIKFEKEQFKKILIQGKEEGTLIFNDIDVTVELISTINNSLDIPFYLHGKYETFRATIKEFIIMIIVALKNSK